MENTLNDQVAAFRYGLIAPIVCRQTLFFASTFSLYLQTSFATATAGNFLCETLH
jgi:hypothetical protein